MPVTPRIGPKRIQRGLLSFGSADLQISNVILAVDMTRCEIRWQGMSEGMARLWLQNSTTLWAVRDTSGVARQVAWEITEW